MRCVVIREHGAYDRLLHEERPLPEPAAGEVRLAVKAVGLNHLDTWVRRGIPGVRYPLPLVPGCDAAGVIDAVGPGVTSHRAGDAVVLAPGIGCGHCERCVSGSDHLCRAYGIFGESRDGGCAEFLVAPARNFVRKPTALSYPEAASFALTFLTAWHMVVGRAALEPHETILIHAAGSGVSVAAIQIARLIGARILVTARGADKLARARELGAHEMIDYGQKDFGDEVRRITGKRGVDVVVDHVGRDTLDKSLRALARGGRLVTCGGTSGPELATDVRLVFFKNLSILGSTMGSLGELHRIVEHFERGTFRPVVDRVLPIAQVAAGHRALEERQVAGKIVLEMQ
ncbi:MAG: zinc-binding dehydrogenase [Planctomycetes bacterium]|nr:zinc-binding dehydrogenase [Planctomycetota bacterium]